jgi:hypothetical protein
LFKQPLPTDEGVLLTIELKQLHGQRAIGRRDSA